MKYLIILASLLTTLNLFGQDEKPINKGNFLLGGSTNMAYHNQDGESYQINITPSFGFFVENNIAIGLKPNFGYYYTSSDDDELSFKQTSIGAGPFIKCYFNSGLLVELETYFLYGKSKYDYGDMFGSFEDESKQIIFSPGIGYAFFINNKVSLETKLSYQVAKIKSGSNHNDDSESLILSFGFQIFL